MGAKYFQDFGHTFFDVSSASEYMGATYVQQFDLTILARPRFVDMSPSAMNFQFELQFELPDPAEHYESGCLVLQESKGILVKIQISRIKICDATNINMALI